jgi:membrane-associated phospholipid phosphatase
MDSWCFFLLPSLKTRHSRILYIFSAATLVLVVGFSRIALGVHFLTDVLAAIVLGILWLILCMFLENPSDEEPLLQRFQSLAEWNYSAE